MENCSVCLESKCSLYINPCSHTLCPNCYLLLPIKKCPMCREQIKFISDTKPRGKISKIRSCHAVAAISENEEK